MADQQSSTAQPLRKLHAWWAKGWKTDILIGVRGCGLYTDYPHRFFFRIGPWGIDFGPWSRTSVYGNGSHWHSGWHRWRDQELLAWDKAHVHVWGDGLFATEPCVDCGAIPPDGCEPCPKGCRR